MTPAPDLLLPERARSACARSTAAVGPARVSFLRRDPSKRPFLQAAVSPYLYGVLVSWLS
jgi:hypothetical protein